MAGGLGIAPTPYPVAPFLRPSLHHTASASSVRGFSGSLHQAGPASVTFSSPPLQSASFYAATTRKASIGGPTGAGMAPEFGTTQRSRSSSQATRQATFVSRLSQADEDGDPSDWKRCWLYCKVCIRVLVVAFGPMAVEAARLARFPHLPTQPPVDNQSMPGRAFLRVGPLSRRMYQEALAPWQRRFSDVEERQNQQRWWGLQGQGQGHQGRDRPLSPSGSVAVSAGDARGQQGDGAFCAQRLRGMSVDDLRSGYVLGKLPSLALTCAGLLDADVDADAAAADAAEAGGASPAESAAAKVGLIRKEDVLMKMCVTLHSYGCPVPRNEYSMQQLLRALGVEGSFTVLPSMIFASLGAPMSSASETHILRVGGGLDCYKLRRVNHLVNQILEHKVESLPQAIAKLDSIIEEPALYSWQVKLACYAISSGTVAPLFFKGSLLDGLVSGLIGVMAGALWVLSDSSYILGKVGLILTAFLTSFFATILTSHIKGLCPLACHFGAITYLLPGWYDERDLFVDLCALLEVGCPPHPFILLTTMNRTGPSPCRSLSSRPRTCYRAPPGT